MVRYGTVRYVRYGTIGYGTVRYGMVGYGTRSNCYQLRYNIYIEYINCSGEQLEIQVKINN